MNAHILIDFGADASICIVATEIVFLRWSDKAWLVEITNADVVRSLTCLTINRKVVSHRRSPFSNHVVVSIEDTLRELAALVVDIPVTTINERIVLANLATIGSIPFASSFERCFIYIEECTVESSTHTLHSVNAILHCVNTTHFDFLGSILPREVARVRYVNGFGLCTLLGSNQYYTECSLGTVDRSSSSVLEDRDALYIVGVNNLDRWNFHVVQKDKWARATVSRTYLTTNLDSRVRTDFTVRHHDVQTRSSTLKTTTNVRNLTAGEGLFYVNRRYSTCQVDFLLLAETYYYEVVELGVGALKSNVNNLFSAHLYGCCSLTYIRNL